MLHSHMKGIISGILNADSLIVRLVGSSTHLVHLQRLVSPRLGKPDGSKKDEPFAYDAWCWMRDNYLGKHVVVHDIHEVNKQVTVPAFGILEVVYGSIKVVDTKEDVGLAGCEAGWLRLQEENPNMIPRTNIYLAGLIKAQEASKEDERGIWAKRDGTVRNIPESCDVARILKEKRIKCNVEAILSVSSFLVSVVSTYERITLVIAGIKAPPFGDDADLRERAKEDVRNKFFHRKIEVYVSMAIKNQGSFIGYITSKKLQAAIADSVAKGFVIYNDKLADYWPCPDLIAAKQFIAQKLKKGIWAEVPPKENMPMHQLVGTIVSVHGSSGLKIYYDNKEMNLYLNCLDIPLFSTSIPCQKGGYEAHEFIRTNFCKKIVSVDIEGNVDERIYGTVSIRGESINKVLVQKGLGIVSDPICGIPSSQIKDMIAAQEAAKLEKIGAWSQEQPSYIEFCDYSSNDITNEEMERFGFLPIKHDEPNMIFGVIEHIFSSTHFLILIPSTQCAIRISIEGLIPIARSDRFGQAALTHLQEKILQTEVSFCILRYENKNRTFIVKGLQMENNEMDIAENILREGLCEINVKSLENNEIPTYLIVAQEAARALEKNIWSDNTRRFFELSRGTSYPVTVTAVWSPIVLSVQHKGESMDIINGLLGTTTDPLIEIPKKNECVVYKLENRYFRVRVEKVDINRRTASVVLIDFHQQAIASLDDLHKITPELLRIPPQGRRVKLAGLHYENAPSAQQKANNTFLWDNVKNKTIKMQVVVNDPYEPSVTIILQKVNNKPVWIGSSLITQKIASFADSDYPPEFDPIFKPYRPSP